MTTPLAPVAATFVAFGMSLGVWAVVTADVEEAAGLSHAGFGLLLAVALAGSAAVNLLSGGLVERWGTQALLRRSLVVWAVAYGAIGLLSPTPFLALAVVSSFTLGGAVDVAMNVASVAGLSHEPGRLVRFHAYFNFGALLGAGLAGAVLHTGLTWRWAVVGPVALAAVCAWWCGRVDVPAAGAGVHAGLAGSWRAVRSNGLVLLAVVFACGAVVEGGLDTWGVLVLRDRLTVTAVVGALAYATGQGVATLARYAIGPIAGSLGPTRAVAASAGTATVGLVLLAVGPTPAAVVGLVLAAAGISMYWPLLLAVAGRDRERPGLVVGGVTAIGYLGFVVGPPAIGALTEVIELRPALLVLAAMAAFVAVAPGRLRIPIAHDGAGGGTKKPVHTGSSDGPG